MTNDNNIATICQQLDACRLDADLDVFPMQEIYNQFLVASEDEKNDLMESLCSLVQSPRLSFGKLLARGFGGCEDALLAAIMGDEVHLQSVATLLACRGLKEGKLGSIALFTKQVALVAIKTSLLKIFERIKDYFQSFDSSTVVDCIKDEIAKSTDPMLHLRAIDLLASLPNADARLAACKCISDCLKAIQNDEIFSLAIASMLEEVGNSFYACTETFAKIHLSETEAETIISEAALTILSREPSSCGIRCLAHLIGLAKSANISFLEEKGKICRYITTNTASKEYSLICIGKMAMHPSNLARSVDSERNSAGSCLIPMVFDGLVDPDLSAAAMTSIAMIMQSCQLPVDTIVNEVLEAIPDFFSHFMPSRCRSLEAAISNAAFELTEQLLVHRITIKMVLESALFQLLLETGSVTYEGLQKRWSILQGFLNHPFFESDLVSPAERELVRVRVGLGICNSIPASSVVLATERADH